MSQISNALEVTVLPPYVPSEEERASPALYAQNVQELFCKTLGIPAIDQVRESPCKLLTSHISCSVGRSAMCREGMDGFNRAKLES